jgi:transcriptional regulator with XRE-family HTH domain
LVGVEQDDAQMTPSCPSTTHLLQSYLHMEFGERLKELRTRLNYSQKEISEKTGLTLRTIQRIENNEVKPSLYSLRVLGEALQTDLTEVGKPSEAKPYEFNFTIKVTDMNQFLTDLKALVKTHWKTILLIVLVIYLITNYTDIKAGILDAWNGN